MERTGSGYRLQGQCNLQSRTTIFEKKLTIARRRCNTWQSTRQQPQYLFKYSTYRKFVLHKDFTVEDCRTNRKDMPVRSFWKCIRIQKVESFQTSSCQVIVLGSGKRTEVEESIKGSEIVRARDNDIQI